jgi:hypothetical protein
VGVGTTPVAAAWMLTLVETDPLVELAPSVHTVGAGGHAVGARDAGSETAAYAVSNAESAGDRGVCGARIEAIHSENSSGGQPCFAADAMDWIETEAIRYQIVMNCNGGCALQYHSATVPRGAVPRGAVRVEKVERGATRIAGSRGTPAAGLRPRPAREKGFPSNLLLD